MKTFSEIVQLTVKSSREQAIRVGGTRPSYACVLRHARHHLVCDGVEREAIASMAVPVAMAVLDEFIGAEAQS